MRVRLLAGCAAMVTLALLASPTSPVPSPTPLRCRAPAATVQQALPPNASRLETLPTPSDCSTPASSASCRSAQARRASVAITGAAPLPAAGTAVAAVLNLTVTGDGRAGLLDGVAVGQRPARRVDPQRRRASVAPRRRARPAEPGDGARRRRWLDVDLLRDGRLADRRPARLLHPGCVGDRRAHAAAPDPGAPPRHPARTRAASLPARQRTINIPDAVGAGAVALNITTVAWQGGYWQVFQAGTPIPATSNLNSVGPGHVAANQVIAPVDAAGNIDVFTTAGGDLIVDVIGTYTERRRGGQHRRTVRAARRRRRASWTPAARSTRSVPAKRLLPQWAVEVPALTNPAINRSDISALDMNVTINETLSAGYFSVTTAGSSAPGPPVRPPPSTPRTRRRRSPTTRSCPVSARGFEVFSEKGGQVIADVSGYYLGAPAAGGAAGADERRPDARRLRRLRRPARRHDRDRQLGDVDRSRAAAA